MEKIIYNGKDGGRHFILEKGEFFLPFKPQSYSLLPQEGALLCSVISVVSIKIATFSKLGMQTQSFNLTIFNRLLSIIRFSSSTMWWYNVLFRDYEYNLSRSIRCTFTTHNLLCTPISITSDCSAVLTFFIIRRIVIL